eukprot:SM003013S11640  [mRNA]  locus=s3013:2:1386:- [translate_table: standard]
MGFEGGQTPLRLRLPKRGFHSPFRKHFQHLHVGDVVAAVEAGALDGSRLITMKTLVDSGVSQKRVGDGIKLMGRGAEKLKVPLHLEVSRVSQVARAAVEDAGGSVVRVHYNQLGLRALLRPEWFAAKGRLLPRA